MARADIRSEDIVADTAAEDTEIEHIEIAEPVDIEVVDTVEPVNIAYTGPVVRNWAEWPVLLP